MSKYANHDDFAGNAPAEWREETTEQKYAGGLSRIAPSGMRPKASRTRKFEEKTDFGASARWHRNYDIAMFAGTDVPAAGSETKQLDLEKLFGRIERKR